MDWVLTLLCRKKKKSKNDNNPATGPASIL